MNAPPNALILAEHREVIWLGGSATACPSGRIPWDVILAALEGDMTTEDQIKALIALAHFLRNGYNLADLSDQDKAACREAVALIP